MTIDGTHFACRARAITPDNRGAEAEVPVNPEVHRPSRVVV